MYRRQSLALKGMSRLTAGWRELWHGSAISNILKACFSQTLKSTVISFPNDPRMYFLVQFPQITERPLLPSEWSMARFWKSHLPWSMSSVSRAVLRRSQQRKIKSLCVLLNLQFGSRRQTDHTTLGQDPSPSLLSHLQ